MEDEKNFFPRVDAMGKSIDGPTAATVTPNADHDQLRWLVAHWRRCAAIIVTDDLHPSGEDIYHVCAYQLERYLNRLSPAAREAQGTNADPTSADGENK